MMRRGMVGLVGAAALAMVCSMPAWADTKIGYVDFDKLQSESPQGKAAMDALRNEFASRQKELQAEQAAFKTKEDQLQRDGATMAADQRAKMEKDLRDGEREWQIKANSFQEDVNARTSEERTKVGKAVYAEVQNYAQAQHYDMVISGQALFFATPALDITPQVLAALQARSPRPATTTPAPKTK